MCEYLWWSLTNEFIVFALGVFLYFDTISFIIFESKKGEVGWIKKITSGITIFFSLILFKKWKTTSKDFALSPEIFFGLLIVSTLFFLQILSILLLSTNLY